MLELEYFIGHIYAYFLLKWTWNPAHILGTGKGSLLCELLCVFLDELKYWISSHMIHIDRVFLQCELSHALSIAFSWQILSYNGSKSVCKIFYGMLHVLF